MTNADDGFTFVKKKKGRKGSKGGSGKVVAQIQRSNPENTKENRDKNIRCVVAFFFLFFHPADPRGVTYRELLP